MTEIEVVRNSHLVDPQLHVWGWEIPVYLFLGGVAAGIMVLSGLLSRRLPLEARSPWSRWMPLTVPVILGVGMLVLFLDLEYKAHVYRFYLSFQPTSPMSWGSWILLAVFPASLLLGLGSLRAEEVARWAGCPPQDACDTWLTRLWTWAGARVRGLGVVNIGLGVGLGVYTGVLLSALGTARPVWNSALLGPLFLVSGLSTGAALMMLLPIHGEEHERLRYWDLAAIGLEAFLLFLFLLALLTGGGTAGLEAAGLLLGGDFTAPFFALVVLAGLVVPFLMEWVESSRQLAPSRVAPVLVLVGGLSLRWILVLAGQA